MESMIWWPLEGVSEPSPQHLRNQYPLNVLGRFFTSNPDLVDKLRTQQPLYHYQRKLFYGPFEDNSLGYVRFENLRYSGKEDVGKAQLAD